MPRLTASSAFVYLASLGGENQRIGILRRRLADTSAPLRRRLAGAAPRESPRWAIH